MALNALNHTVKENLIRTWNILRNRSITFPQNEILYDGSLYHKKPVHWFALLINGLISISQGPLSWKSYLFRGLGRAGSSVASLKCLTLRKEFWLVFLTITTLKHVENSNENIQLKSTFSYFPHGQKRKNYLRLTNFGYWAMNILDGKYQ